MAMRTEDMNFMTMGEVARYLGVSGDTVRRIVGRGELPAWKCGTWLRFKPEDVEAYKASCKLN
jgi:excisionase family DNA binding protein